MKKISIFTVCAIVAASAFAQAQQKGVDEKQSGSPAVIEARAKRMVNNAKSLIENGEDDRAVSLLEAIPKMFPDAPSRFVAFLELGRHQLDKRQFDASGASLRKAFGSADPEVQAESLLLQGRAQLERGQAGDAAMLLRRVTQDYPTSLFSNDAYFLIGQIHFDAGRWSRAAEAFQMVGTAVPTEMTVSNVLTEAGQRIYVHVTDKDLAVLAALGEIEEVEIVSNSGDKEKAKLQSFGRGDGDFLASVDTTTDVTQPNDGRLTVHGGDGIAVNYLDRNTESGDVRQPRNADAKIVSTGTVTFMDGAQRQKVRGVFCGQPAFILVRDLDADKTPNPDTIRVPIAAQFKERPEVPEGQPPQPPAPDAPWIQRTMVEIDLVETAPRSGVFAGRITPQIINTDTNQPPVVIQTGEIGVLPEDRIVVQYEDATHLQGSEPQMRIAEAAVLVGGSTEPQSIVANASDAMIQAKKLLLEAKLLHKWGNIFKEVGLDVQASEKAEEGLMKVDELMALAARFSLERAVVEEAFAVKWDLQLVQGNLQAAIATCNQLVRIFPDTTLADRAFMQIGNARMESAKKDPSALRSAIQVYNAILKLPLSPLKAEAQYRIGEATEQAIRHNAHATGRKADFSPAMTAFKRCAEAYPESAFAGDSFKKVVDYYISIRDYTRCIETFERVFQDYPDAPWLDEMLLKWGVVAHRMGNTEEAISKFQRLVEEYPGGQAANQGQQFLRRLSDY